MNSFEYRFQFRKCFSRTFTVLDGFFCYLDFFGTSHISRVFSGQGKFCQSQWVGTERRSLAGRNQFIRCSNRIVNLRYDFQDQVLSQCRHLWPVFDVRSELNLHRRICNTLTVEYSVLIDSSIKVIFRIAICSRILSSRSQASFVCCSRRDRTGIHQGYGRDLSILDLRTFTVREVSCRMADTESIICRCITGAEARTTECSFYDGTCLDESCQCSVLCKFHINRCTCRINTQCKCICSDACTFQDIRSRTDIFKSTTGTSCDNSLFHIQFSIVYLIFQCEINFSIQADLCFFLHIIQNIHQVGI